MAFRSVAPRLIEAGVGSVLAMSYAVHVEAAKILVEHFYRALVQGTTIGAAVEEGRAALNANRDRWLDYGLTTPTIQLADWFLLQLYQRGEDSVLVEGARARGRGAARAPDRAARDEATARQRFEEAERSFQESLAVWCDTSNKAYEAMSAGPRSPLRPAPRRRRRSPQQRVGSTHSGTPPGCNKHLSPAFRRVGGRAAWEYLAPVSRQPH